MASYSYGGLTVPVTADTRDLARQVAAAARTSGQQAATTLGTQLGRGLSDRRVGGAMRGVGRVAVGTAKVVGSALATGFTVAGGAAAAFGVKAVRAGARANAASQDQLATMTALLGSQRAATALMAQISQINLTSIFPKGVFVDAAKQLHGFGVETSRIPGMLKAINLAAMASGDRTGAAVGQITNALGRVQSSGKFTTRTFATLGKSGIDAASLIGKQMGLTGDQVRAGLTKGTIDGRKALEALTTQMQVSYAGAGKMVAQTWSGVTALLRKQVTGLGKTLAAPFINPAGGGYFVSWGNKLLAMFNALQPVIAQLMARVMKAIGPTLSRVAPLMDKITAGITKMGQGKGLDNLVGQFGKLAPALLPLMTLIGGRGISNIAGALGPLGPIVQGLLGPLGGFGTAIAAMVLTVPDARNGLMQLATTAMKALAPVFPVLMPLISQLATILGQGLGQVLIDLAPVLVQLIQLLGPILVLSVQMLVMAMRVLMPVITFVVGLLAAIIRNKVVAAVVIGIAAAFFLLNTAAAPWIIAGVAIVALLAGLYYAFTHFGAIVRAVGAVLTVAWTAVWNFLKAAFTWVRTNWPLLLGILTGPIGLAVLYIARHWAAIRAATVAVFNAIRNVIMSALNAAKNAVNTALWAIRTAFNLTVAFLGRLWSAGWTRLRNTVTSVGTWIQNWLGGLWGRIRTGAANAWNGIVNTIKNVFDRIKGVVMAPVRWVVRNVINRVIGGINTLITKVGIAKIALIPGFRSGGRIPGGWGGGDKQFIAAEPGEWVLTKEQSRAIGYENLRRLPRYQQGGLVGDEHMPGGIAPRFPSLKQIGGAFVRVTGLDNLARAARDLFDPVTRLLTFAASQAFGALTAPLKKMVQPWTVDPRVFPYQWLGKLTTTAIDKAVAFIAGKSMDACGSLSSGNVGGIVGRALKFNGHAYRWAGGANPSTGFDCSSFVSYIAGISGLPLPGGFRVPSGAHGPVTTDYLRWGGMRSKSLSRTKPGDVAVSPTHIGFIIGPGGSGFAARSTETGIGPQNFARGGYTYREWLANKGSAPGTTTGICAPGVGGGLGIPGNIESWRRLVTQMAVRFGIPETVNAWLTQIRTESGGNPNAIQQVHDVNWPHNRAQGLLQVIPTTFAAYAGPYRNLGPLNPAANIFAAMAYAISRYGRRNILSVIGHGHGYAGGGLVGEPVVGFGMRSGTPYSFGERGPEWVSPLVGPGPQLGQGNARIQITVYPSAGMDERELAAKVSRRLQWALEGGMG